MPRIPLSTAQKIGHVDAEVNQQSAPGMGFGMDDARALQNAGDAIGQAGRGLGSALMQFGERVQEAEDRLAAAEYETAWNQRQKELETRMKENPGSVKEFGKWASDSDTEWDEVSKQYTNRMSKRYRDVFEMNWRRHRDNAMYRRQELTIQAQVKSLQDRCAKQIQELISLGDYDGAKKLIAEFRNIPDNNGKPCSPFTEDQINGFVEFVDKSKTFGLLRNMFDSGDAVQIKTALDRLKEKDGASGKYTCYPKLTEEERARWIKYGENVQMQQRNDAAKAYLAKVHSTGEYQNKEELNELLKAGVITAEEYNFRWNIAEGKEQEAEREQRKRFALSLNNMIAQYRITGKFNISSTQAKQMLDSGIITPEQYNILVETVENLRSAKAAEYSRHVRAEQQNMQESWKACKSDFLTRLYTADYPPNHLHASFRNQIIGEINAKTDLSVGQKLELIQLLDDFLKDDPLDKTEIGRMLKEDIQIFLRSLDENPKEGIIGEYPKGGITIQNFFSDRDTPTIRSAPSYSNNDMVRLKFELVSLARIFAQQPGATYDSVQKQLQPYKDAILNAQVTTFFNPRTNQFYNWARKQKAIGSHSTYTERTTEGTINVWSFGENTPDDPSDDYEVIGDTFYDLFPMYRRNKDSKWSRIKVLQ